MLNENLISKAKEYYNLSNLYLPLSSGAADFEKGVSVPFLAQNDMGKNIIFLFSDYEKAKSFVKSSDIHIFDNVYPIAKIFKNDKQNGISYLMKNAMDFNISEIYFDYGFSNYFFSCSIIDFIKVNLIKMPNLMVQEKNKTLNFLPIFDYNNPYILANERKKTILDETLSENCTNYLFNEQSLHENCFALSYINDYLLPEAKKDYDKDCINHFTKVCDILKKVISVKLKRQSELFTLSDNNALVVFEKAIYIIYTERFSNKSKNTYVRISDLKKFIKNIKNFDVTRIIVTNGTDYSVVLPISCFE